MADEENWRLQAELDVEDAHGALHNLLGRLRGPNVVKDVEAAVAKDVVITHDQELLFAYATSEAEIATARAAIEDVLRRDEIAARVRISHWDGGAERWQQTEPPLSAEEARADADAERDGDEIETRTMVANSGKLVRAEFEQTMLTWAGRLGLECQLIEHPHLLTTQIGFTVTGPRRKVDEFSSGLTAEGWTMFRTEESISFGI
jgi:hypothetical protein